MSKLCKCCSHEIIGNKCSYCGYMNIVALDEKAMQEEVRRSEEYFERIVYGITEFSIKKYVYVWDDDSHEPKLSAEEKCVICSAADCIDKIAWSAEYFGQNPADEDACRVLEVMYRVGDKEKTVVVSVPPVKCDDYWRIGLKLDRQLRLTVYLGTQMVNSKSEPCDLEIAV